MIYKERIKIISKEKGFKVSDELSEKIVKFARKRLFDAIKRAEKEIEETLLLEREHKK